MVTIDRIINNNDWISLLILGVVFLLVLLSFSHQKRLHDLLLLPYNDSYLLNYPQQIWHIFNLLFFVISTIVISLFIYIVIQYFFPEKISHKTYPFLKILALVVFYWSLKHGVGKLIAYLFEIKKMQYKATFLKMSYFFSSSLYLLILLIFILYFIDYRTFFIKLTLVVYAILLLIRYARFLSAYKRELSTHLFYIILYLCALEIAPLFIVIKIGL